MIKHKMCNPLAQLFTILLLTVVPSPTDTKSEIGFSVRLTDKFLFSGMLSHPALSFSPRGNDTLFSLPKRKKCQKRSWQASRLTAAPINGPARAYLLPNVRCVSGDCTCTRKQGSRNFVSRADFANLIGALVRIRVHHANRLASRRRDANARWFVGSKVEICF